MWQGKRTAVRQRTSAPAPRLPAMEPNFDQKAVDDLKAALKGDLKASKLFLDATKEQKTSETKVNTQHNYVQINKTVINQQVIQQLKPEQLKLIEQIIAGNESKPE